MVPTDFHIFQRVEVKQYHKAPIWERFYGPIYSDLGDGLVLFYPHWSIAMNVLCSNVNLYTYNNKDASMAVDMYMLFL